ncbi:hypothetical protein CGCF415_v013463 [Colletotrichum fructicola]|nr:hypothetical protein CGCF415_v013463 [Colletotrichum fructicola]
MGIPYGYLDLVPTQGNLQQHPPAYHPTTLPYFTGYAQETQQEQQQEQQQTQGTKEGSSPSIPLCPSHPIFFTPKSVHNPSLLFAWLANAMLSRASFSLGPANPSRLPPPSIAKFRRRQPDHGGQMDRQHQHQHQQRCMYQRCQRRAATGVPTSSSMRT